MNIQSVLIPSLLMWTLFEIIWRYIKVGVEWEWNGKLKCFLFLLLWIYHCSMMRHTRRLNTRLTCIGNLYQYFKRIWILWKETFWINPNLQSSPKTTLLCRKLGKIRCEEFSNVKLESCKKQNIAIHFKYHSLLMIIISFIKLLSISDKFLINR